MNAQSERARECERRRKEKLCRQIIREARRCVELAGNPIRIIDPDTARTAPRRKHHIRA